MSAQNVFSIFFNDLCVVPLDMFAARCKNSEKACAGGYRLVVFGSAPRLSCGSMLAVCAIVSCLCMSLPVSPAVQAATDWAARYCVSWAQEPPPMCISMCSTCIG